MIITFHGDACIKLQVGESTMIFNPPSKDSSVKQVRSTAQATLISSRVPLIEAAPISQDSFLIHTAGEYEVNGTFIQAFPSQTLEGGEISNNILYLFNFDDMKIVNMGLLSHTDLDASFTEHIDDIDILFIPISGKGTLDPSEAYELAVKLQPRLIIPTMFNGVKDSNLDIFLKEAGATVEPEDKITLKKKDLSELENSVRVLNPLGI